MAIINKIKSKKSLFESILSLSVLNAINVLLPLTTLPYLLRVIGADNFGIYSFIYVIIQYLLLITSYGFNYTATKEVALNRNNNEFLNQLFTNVFIIRLILLLFCLIIVLLTSPLLFKSEGYFILFIFGLGIVIGDILNPVWLFQGMEKMRYVTIVNFVSRIIFTALIFIFIKKSSDYKYILLINSIGYLISGLISTYIAKKQFHTFFVKPNFFDLKIQMKNGFSLFASTIGTNLYSNANVFILSFFVSNYYVGVYAAAEKVIKGLQSLTSPITQALFPHIGHSLKDISIQKRVLIIKKISLYSVISLIIPCIFVFIWSDKIVEIIAGKNFTESIILVKIMSPVILIGTLNFILGVVGLVNLNYQDTFFVAVMIAGIISVLVLVLSVNFLGVLAGALSVLISEFVLLLICLNKYRLILKMEYNK